MRKRLKRLQCSIVRASPRLRRLLLSSVVRHIQDHAGSRSREAVEPTDKPSFQRNEFGLERLRKIGKLNFEWTSSVSEHLVLDIDYGQPTLKIFWFGFAIQAQPAFQWVHHACTFDQLTYSLALGATYLVLTGMPTLSGKTAIL